MDHRLRASRAATVAYERSDMNRDSSVLPAIEVRGLSKTFTLHLRGGQQLPVLRCFEMEVYPGECVALVGASGQGKSTLMKCLYGSYGCEQGHIVMRSDDRSVDLAHATPREVLQWRRNGISYVSQFLRAVPRVSALDVVAERLLESTADEACELDDAHHEQRAAAAREQAQALLGRLNLPPALWELPPATFSGGEQQRVNIARGFIKPTPVLLLDEPTASLDAANRRIVMQLIDEAKARGAAIVGIFHDEEVRDAVATRLVGFA